MMQTSRVLARVIGPSLIITGVGILLNLGTYQHMIEEYSKSASLCYLGGFVALLLGLIVLQFHNVWEARWPVVITILGWIAFIKGAVLIVFPGLIHNLWLPYVGSPVPLIVSLSISLVVGVFLTIKGYWG
ncbi:MAG TPA: hypothetical protein VMC85_08105 [Desulfomonilaceae bacterium]|nr:hypothetical protein [Desulfomonilaceae bacterium]